MPSDRYKKAVLQFFLQGSLIHFFYHTMKYLKYVLFGLLFLVYFTVYRGALSNVCRIFFKSHFYRHIVTIAAVNIFLSVYLAPMVTADTQTITPMVYMYLQVFGAGNVVTERNAGLGAAVGVVLSLIVVAVFILTTAIVREEEIEF